PIESAILHYRIGTDDVEKTLGVVDPGIATDTRRGTTIKCIAGRRGQGRRAAATGRCRSVVVTLETQRFQAATAIEDDAVRQHLLQRDITRQGGTHAIQFFRLSTR